MAAIATSARDPADPVATWSYIDVAEALRAEGIEASVSQVWRILTSMDIDLTKVRGWLNRRDDPEFWERVRDVCGLYLDPPQQALVLSVDEKTSIQAKSRKHPDQPGPARAGRDAASSNTSVTAPPRCSPPSTCTPVRCSPNRSPHATREATTRSTSAPSWTTSIANVDPTLAIHIIVGQRRQPRLPAHPSVVRRPSPLARPLHAEARLVGQPGRAVLLDPATQSDHQRRLPSPRRPDRQAPRLHRQLQRESETVPMDLRRRPTRRELD